LKNRPTKWGERSLLSSPMFHTGVLTPEIPFWDQKKQRGTPAPLNQKKCDRPSSKAPAFFPNGLRGFVFI